jgi:hypothetical protein
MSAVHALEGPETALHWEYECREALRERFGWLWGELSKVQGNVSALKEHQQVLWRGREKAISEFNRIGKIRDEPRQVRLYRKLWRELQ